MSSTIDRAGLGAMFLDRRFQFAIRQVLDAQVDAGDQVAAGVRRADAFDVLDRAAETILNDALGAGLRAEPAVVRQLQSFLSDVVVLLGEAEQMAGDFARRIEALIFAQQVNAGNFSSATCAASLGRM